MANKCHNYYGNFLRFSWIFSRRFIDNSEQTKWCQQKSLSLFPYCWYLLLVVANQSLASVPVVGPDWVQGGSLYVDGGFKNLIKKANN